MVDELAELRNADRSLFPSSLTIRALRDSRYHNSAYAIAELIDNFYRSKSRANRTPMYGKFTDGDCSR